MKIATILTTILIFAEQALAYPNFIGYSGSPGENSCSVHCHHMHSYSPTITVTGFPATYIPDQQYTIAIAHNGGGSISNFNCSARIGTGIHNAGVIASGTNTLIYDTTGETNGVHFSVNGANAGNFLWTAPSAGTGDIRLYWAGLQGGLSNGADTQIVLISNEAVTGLDDNPRTPDKISLQQNYPNPFNSETIIEFTFMKSGDAKFEIDNILGQEVYGLFKHFDSPGIYSIRWDGKNADGIDLPSGIYFYRLATDDGIQTRKMILMR